MKKLLRFLLWIPAPKISKEEAVALGKAEAESRQWSSSETVVVRENLRSYDVYIGERSPRIAYFKISIYDGKILDAYQIPMR